MKKTTRNSLIFLVVVIVVFTLISIGYHHFKSEPMDANTADNNIQIDDNTEIDNVLNETVDVDEKNETTNTEEKTTENNKEQKSEEKTTKKQENNIITKEDKAISLVKKQWKADWGNLDGVSFSASIQSNGKYGVTVYDAKTTQSIQFYIVDLETETVKEK